MLKVKQWYNFGNYTEEIDIVKTILISVTSKLIEIKTDKAELLEVFIE